MAREGEILKRSEGPSGAAQLKAVRHPSDHKGSPLAEPYLERLTETIASLDISTSDEMVLELKHFFSGAALYVNGKICVTLTPAGFGLKLPQVSINQLIDVGDGKELRYFDNAPIKKEYVALSQSIMNDPDRLKTMMRQSMDYVVSKG